MDPDQTLTSDLCPFTSNAIRTCFSLPWFVLTVYEPHRCPSASADFPPAPLTLCRVAARCRFPSFLFLCVRSSCSWCSCGFLVGVGCFHVQPVFGLYHYNFLLPLHLCLLLLFYFLLGWLIKDHSSRLCEIKIKIKKASYLIFSPLSSSCHHYVIL